MPPLTLSCTRSSKGRSVLIRSSTRRACFGRTEADVDLNLSLSRNYVAARSASNDTDIKTRVACRVAE